MNEKMNTIYRELNNGLTVQVGANRDLLDVANLALTRAQKISRLIENVCSDGDFAACPDDYEPVVFALCNYIQDAIGAVRQTMDWLYTLECSVPEEKPDGMQKLTEAEKLTVLKGLADFKRDMITVIQKRNEQAKKVDQLGKANHAEAETELSETA